jgi:para-nitrobenzyl esterase
MGPACPQLDFVTSSPMAGTSEDCLTLNIWTPASPTAAPAPTLFWIHGGGFATGSGGDPSFDGKVLSEATGAVVVTINYRLGPLGFLAHSALASEDSAYPSAGNYGIEDQRAALRWTQTNIAAFGGNPRSVTIFGESAGGISVCLHLLSLRSGGLFHRAILQSGPCTLGTGKTEKDAEVLGDKLADELLCSDPNSVLECLRSKTADEIVAAITPTRTSLTGGGLGWYPNIDGFNLLDAPTKLFETGVFSKLPTLLGANKNEGTVFFTPGAPPLTEADFVALMESYFPDSAPAIVAKYASATYGTVQKAAEEALGDGLFVCPTRFAARALSQAGAPTYLYQFEHAVTSAMFPGFGAFHSSDIPFIFGNPYWDIMLDAGEQELAKTMRGYWGRMATSGNPNGQGAPVWPRYDPATDQHLVIDLTFGAAHGLKADLCDFWDAIGR